MTRSRPPFSPGRSQYPCRLHHLAPPGAKPKSDPTARPFPRRTTRDQLDDRLTHRLRLAGWEPPMFEPLGRSPPQPTSEGRFGSLRRHRHLTGLAVAVVAAASPDISSRAAMIAQDFSRVRVLGAFSRGARGGTPRKRRDGSIATPYGVATTCAQAGKSAPQAAPSAPPVARPHRARARPAQLVSGPGSFSGTGHYRKYRASVNCAAAQS